MLLFSLLFPLVYAVDCAWDGELPCSFASLCSIHFLAGKVKAEPEADDEDYASMKVGESL